MSHQEWVMIIALSSRPFECEIQLNIPSIPIVGNIGRETDGKGVH